MNLTALKGRVIIRAQQPGGVTPGGLLIVPGTAKRQSGCLGTVVSSGVESIRAGDRVAFESIWAGDYALRHRLEDGTDLYSVEEKRVMAIIEDVIECRLCGELATAALTPEGDTPYCARCAR